MSRGVYVSVISMQKKMRQFDAIKTISLQALKKYAYKFKIQSARLVLIVEKYYAYR